MFHYVWYITLYYTLATHGLRRYLFAYIVYSYLLAIAIYAYCQMLNFIDAIDIAIDITELPALFWCQISYAAMILAPLPYRFINTPLMTVYYAAYAIAFIAEFYLF